MDSVDILRSSYLVATLGCLLITVTPALRDRFLAYGPRASKTTKEKEDEKTKSQESDKNVVLSQLLDSVAKLTIPHAFFSTFYFLSSVLSVYWLLEWRGGPALEAVALRTRDRGTSMSIEQVKIAWAMMLAQGFRRFYECTDLTIYSPGDKNRSQMHIGHWILGLLFYIATSVAVWIEGLDALQTHRFSFLDFTFKPPTLRTIFSILVFILASGIQHDCHVYLAFLKAIKPKDEEEGGPYKIPLHPAFHFLIAPHYTAECIIYLSLAVVAAPRGHWLNLTLTSALVFVVVNLGVTASFTRQWYAKKFGPEAVKGKWNIIPFVY